MKNQCVRCKTTDSLTTYDFKNRHFKVGYTTSVSSVSTTTATVPICPACKRIFKLHNYIKYLGYVLIWFGVMGLITSPYIFSPPPIIPSLILISVGIIVFIISFRVFDAPSKYVMIIGGKVMKLNQFKIPTTDNSVNLERNARSPIIGLENEPLKKKEKPAHIARNVRKLARKGDLPGAIKLFEHALEIYTQRRDYSSIDFVMNDIVGIYLAIGNHKGALKLLEGILENITKRGLNKPPYANLVIKNIQNIKNIMK